MCSHHLQFNRSNYGLTFIHFLFDILISRYPKLLFTPLLLLLSAPPSHRWPSQTFFFKNWHCPLHFLNYSLSPFFFDLSDNPLNVNFFSFPSFVSLFFFFIKIPGVTVFIGFSACLRERMCTVLFLPKCYPSSQLHRAMFVRYQLKENITFQSIIRL